MLWGVGSGVRPAPSIRPGALNEEKQKNRVMQEISLQKSQNSLQNSFRN